MVRNFFSKFIASARPVYSSIVILRLLVVLIHHLNSGDVWGMIDDVWGIQRPLRLYRSAAVCRIGYRSYRVPRLAPPFL